MTRDELNLLHTRTTFKAVELMKQKNADYCGVGDDALSNFRKHGAFGIVVRLHDKMERLNTFVKRGSFAVIDESFEDTIVDVINYSILLLAMVNEGKK